MFEDYKSVIRSHTDYEFSANSEAFYFAKYVCINRLMIIELPVLNTESVLVNKLSIKPLEIKGYFIDILEIEYPRGLEIFRKNQDLAVLFQDNTVTQIQDNFFATLKQALQTVYCRNVYKACSEDLNPSDEDLEKVLNLCSFVTSEEIDITQLIKTLSQENPSFESFHHFSKETNPEDAEIGEENPAKNNDSEGPSENGDKEEELDCEMIAGTFDGLIKWYFKRVGNKNLYVEQNESLDVLIREFKEKNQPFVEELAPLHCKSVKIS